MSKKYAIEFTLGEVIALTAELTANFNGLGYNVERILNDPVEDVVEHMWAVNDATRAAEKRAALAGLIATLTGDPFGDVTEVARVKVAVKAAQDFKAAQDAAATANV